MIIAYLVSLAVIKVNVLIEVTIKGLKHKTLFYSRKELSDSSRLARQIHLPVWLNKPLKRNIAITILLYLFKGNFSIAEIIQMKYTINRVRLSRRRRRKPPRQKMLLLIHRPNL
jgi:hypothetical protein